MPVVVGRLTSIVVNFTWPPRRGCAYAVVDVVSWSVSVAPRAAENTTISSGIVVVWTLLSSSTLIGVIGLPSTRPVAGSTICAKTRVGRSPAGAVPEYVIVSFGAPSTGAALAKLTVTSTPFVARAGVKAPAMLPSTAVGAPATGRAGANFVGTNARSPAPCALIGGPDVGGDVSATSSAPFWSTVANAGRSCAEVSPFT